MDQEHASGTLVSIHLAGTFSLSVGGSRTCVPHSVERVLARLALANGTVSRTRLAGELWFDAQEQRAASNLRTALWRMNRVGARVVVATQDVLALAPDVAVDIQELSAFFHQAICGVSPDAVVGSEMLMTHTDLLPEWEELWVVSERERFRLLRLEALESASSTLIAAQRYWDALDLALFAIRSEPLRESAWRLVVRIHLLQGNLAEAVRAYQQYRTMLLDEMDMTPSHLMQDLVRPLMGADAADMKVTCP